ncbi:MAG TPA: hypothetical protein PKE30_01245 [Niabella sp.]|nr:hypothetical protein [Niabella sp.]
MQLLALIISIGLLSCNGRVHNDVEQAFPSANNISPMHDSLKVKSKELQNLLSDYDTSNVLISYFFLLNSKERILRSDNKLYSFCDPLDSSVMQNKTLYILKIDSIFAMNQNKNGVRALVKWCENEVFLNALLKSPLNSKGKVYFEELMDELPKTKEILKKYLKKQNQYWGSLDVEQSCNLYYDILLYLQSLDEKQRLMFFRSYLNILTEKLLE